MKKILFFTNSEYGQANVVFATAYELLLRGCEIHIASFDSAGASLGSSVQKRVTDLNYEVYGAVPKGNKGAIFHRINGPSMTEALLRKFTDPSVFLHGTGVKEALRMYPLLTQVVCAWDGQEYIQGYDSCVEIIKTVGPDIIVIEILCAQAIDACNILHRNFIILSPNTFKETLGGVQPYLFGLWGIPEVISGFSFPVPWYLIPINIYLKIRLIISIIFSPQIRDVNVFRKACGLTTLFPFLEPYSPKHHYLIPSALECDFRFSKIPSNVTACGPILLPSPALSVADPELETWLKRKPTVLVNLGSNYVSAPAFSQALATALRIQLERNSDVQVLWKLKINGDLVSEVGEILSKEIATGRVKIESWLKAEPGALLRSGHIICSVHHGGANSYYEAVSAGVPQIVLPCWFDTFDFAQRVEYHGIGIYGSRSVAPEVDAEELGKALVTITDPKNEKGKEIVLRAKELGQVLKKYGGRKTAAEKILELAVHADFRSRDVA